MILDGLSGSMDICGSTMEGGECPRINPISQYEPSDADSGVANAQLQVLRCAKHFDKDRSSRFSNGVGLRNHAVAGC
jgi:hypothetical protein